MGKHLITVEVDTDRDLYGSSWGANFDNVRKHTDEEIGKGLKGGELISSGWDHPPFMRVVDVRQGPTDAELALTQIQHLTYDAGLRAERLELGGELPPLVDRVCRIAEAGEPDKSWREDFSAALAESDPAA